MITAIITLLIYLCILAIVVYLIIWVLGIIGLPIPQKVIQLIWVIAALIAILMIVQFLAGAGGVHLGKLTLLNA